MNNTELVFVRSAPDQEARGTGQVALPVTDFFSLQYEGAWIAMRNKWDGRTYIGRIVRTGPGSEFSVVNAGGNRISDYIDEWVVYRWFNSEIHLVEAR